MVHLCLLVVIFVMSLVSGHHIHNSWDETDSQPASRSSRSQPDCPGTQSVNCGRRPGFWHGDDGLDKIIGGHRARHGAIPWIARVQKLVWVEGTLYASILCAGVIINPYWILTAALCRSSRSPLSDLRIVVGNPNTRRVQEGQQEFHVTAFYPHPNFTGGATYFDYNIALYKITPTSDGCGIRYNLFVQPICLPSASFIVSKFHVVLTGGWGSTVYGEEGVSRVLQRVWLACEDIENCGRYVYERRFLTERMFCAGEKHRSTDACAADIGGPAVYLTQGRYILLGIISHGTLCEPPNSKVVMANVPKYRDWVIDTVNANSAGVERVFPVDNITTSSG